jgi:uncharacterized membrane protein
MIRPRALIAACLLPLALAACDGGASEPASAVGERTGERAAAPAAAPGAAPGDTNDTAAYSGIGAAETIHFTGTEPFWGGESAGGTLIYSTPEDIEGTTIAVERFAGRGGLSLAGQLDGAPFDMAITPGDCSDGMSDRTYPFTVTLQVRGEQRQGCAWTDAQSFTGPLHP